MSLLPSVLLTHSIVHLQAASAPAQAQGASKAKKEDEEEMTPNVSFVELISR